MRGAVEFTFVDFAVRRHRRRIEHTQAHARREQTNERSVDCALSKITLLHSLDVWPVIVIVSHFGDEVDAFVVHAALQRDS